MAKKPSARGAANLRSLAALLHYMAHSALAVGEPSASAAAAATAAASDGTGTGTGTGGLVDQAHRAAMDETLGQDAEVAQPFSAELLKLRQQYVETVQRPELVDFLNESRAALRTWSTAMLRTAATAEDERK